MTEDRDQPGLAVSDWEARLLNDPERLARVDAALAAPDAAVVWVPRTAGPARP